MKNIYITFVVTINMIEMVKVLVIDDEPDILEFVSYNLKKENFTVFTANNGKKGLKLAKKEKPDLILLDMMMPEMDGVETCEKIRTIEKLKNTIIVFLSARAEEYSQVYAFEAGANDYITKPISPKLLVKKITGLLKLKTKEKTKSIVEIGDITINNDTYKVKYKDNKIVLPKKEFQLLSLLASNPNKVFKREEILETVWGYDVVVGDRTIDVHIRKLREKFGKNKFLTVKGVGYKIEI